MKLLRINSWWNFIVPQILGWFYFSLLTDTIYRRQNPVVPYFTSLNLVSIKRDGLFFLWLISTAAFGYLFNDLCDVEADKLGGKTNGLAKFHLKWRIAIVSIPFLIGVFAWFEMNRYLAHSLRTDLANVLIGAQFLTLIVYSIKPLRVKERAELGVIFDAFYGHLNPVLITFCVFGLYPFSSGWYNSFIATLIFVCTIKGIRNILLHQIEDRKKDNAAGLNTAVIKYGPYFTINFINNFLFPAEVIFLLCLTLTMFVHIPLCIIPFALFAVTSYFKFSGWKFVYLDKKRLDFTFTYFMNDYYEEWLPVFLLLFISIYRIEFLLLLILHLLFFPSFIKRIGHYVKAIGQNFSFDKVLVKEPEALTISNPNSESKAGKF